MILLGSDHNGVGLKSALASALTEQGIPWIDFGPMKPVTTDYTQIADQVANALVVRRQVFHTNDCAILCCGTGMGMSIVSNRVPGARAALVHNQMSAIKSREHNDTNILCLGAWITHDAVNVALAMEWLNTKFGEGRHVRRVELISAEPDGKIVFANGVFDILHKGHIEMLQWARRLGDRLVVAINSDASTRSIKGSQRPINGQDDRRSVLSALACVDEVLVFDEVSPYEMIQQIQPHVIVRGGEFTADEIRARDGIPDHIEIKVFPRVPEYSTTKTIEKVRA